MSKLKAFFLGIIAALGALVTESLVLVLADSFFTSANLSSASWPMPAAVLIEEVFKMALIWKFSQKIVSRRNAFVSAIFIGLGFSAMEIVFNLFGGFESFFAVPLSYLGLVLIHTATTGIFGYYFSVQKKPSFILSALILLLAFFIHLVFNAAVLAELGYGIILGLPAVILIFLFFRAFQAEKNHFLPSGKK